ncbi:MAG TPA: histidinol-phosphate transaminase [Candidatus Dormibacteraeota bacterium]
MTLRDLVREPLRSVAAYDPGPTLSELKQRYGLKEIVKLNWNEDLFGLFPGVREAIIEEIGRAELYPEQAYSDFRELVAERTGADPSMLVPSHGIQSLIFSSVAAFVNPGDRVVIPQPTYGLYRQACEAAGAEVVRIPTKGYRFDLEAMLAAAAGAKLVFISDPNNPTGDALSATEWTALIESIPSGCVAIVDEAYADYIEPDARPQRVEDVRQGRPVVVLRTFSKLFGLAGLRLGYAVVHPDMVPAFDAVQEPFNVNRLALAAGRACLADPKQIESRRSEVVRAREAFAGQLRRLGIECWPSQANFVLVKVGGDALRWSEELLRRGYLVRPGSEYGLAGHLRITIGPEPLMQAVAEAIAQVGEELKRPTGVG